MKTVVTGAAGFIGSHLTDTLLAMGHEVVGIDNFDPYYDSPYKWSNLKSALLQPGFRLLQADLLTLDLGSVLEGTDVLFHLAGQPGVRPSFGEGFAHYTRTNVTATERLLAAATETGVSRVVYASSSSVYGDAPLPMEEEGATRPTSPYGVTKLAGEHLVRLYHREGGPVTVGLRFFTVYGPRQRPDMAFHRFIQALSQGEPIEVNGDGQQTRDFTYVGDIVAGMIAAATATATERVYNLGGGSRVSLMEAIHTLAGVMGVTPTIRYLPAARGDSRHTLAAMDRARRDLHFTPSVDLREGLRRQVASMLPQPAETRSRAKRPLLLYAHDGFGLGHFRRTMAIARARLAEEPDRPVILATGSPLLDRFPAPPGLTYVPLSPVSKVGARYRPLDGSPMSACLRQRSRTLERLLLESDPALVLIDHTPLGLLGELIRPLARFRAASPRTPVWLGMRDVVDWPVTIRRLWAKQGITRQMVSFYDRILVYGDAALFDARLAYDLPEAIGQRLVYTGYLLRDALPREPHRYTVAVTAGSGGDGEPLFRLFLEAWPTVRERLGGKAVLLTGPMLDGGAILDLERQGAPLGIEVLPFHEAPPELFRRAGVTLSMGGYNSLAELLPLGGPVVVVPRVEPRKEQAVRSGLLSAVAPVFPLLPDEANAETLAQRILEAHGSRHGGLLLDGAGMKRMSLLLAEALAEEEEELQCGSAMYSNASLV